MGTTQSQMTMKMTAEEADLTNAYLKWVRMQDRATKSTKKGNQALNEQGKAFKKTGGSANKAFGSGAISNLKSYATGLVSVTAGVAAVKAAFNDLVAIQDDMNKSQVTLAQSQDMITRNFSGSKKELQKIFDTGKAISSQVGVKESIINQAIAEGLTASGGDLAGTISATRLSAEFLGSKPGEIAGYAGAGLDIQKVTGSTDMRENFGLLKKTGELSRITSADLQAKNIAPALVGATGAGATATESAALFAALTSASADKTGERTGTALISLLEQVGAFFQEDKKAKGIEQASGGLTAGQRVFALQDDPAMAKKFLEGASFEKKALAPIRGLLTDQSSVAATKFDEYLGKVGDSQALIATTAEALSNLQTTQVQVNAAGQRSADALQEQGKTLDPNMGAMAAARVSRKQGLEATGVGFVARTVAEVDAYISEGFGGQDPRNIAQRQLRGQAAILERRGAAAGGPTEIEQKQIELLGRIADSVEATNGPRVDTPQARPIRNAGDE
jgi:hypothetical protein